MANPNQKLSQEVSNALHIIYKRYSDAIQNTDLRTTALNTQILEKNFVDILKQVSIMYLKDHDFRAAIQDTRQLDPVDSLLFLQIISKGYSALGLGK